MTAGSGLRLLPQAFEPMPGNAGVMGGVLGIAVAEVILHRAQIGPLIRKGNSRSCDAACAATPWRRRSGQNPTASRRARSRTAARPRMSSRPYERAHLGSPAIGARRRARLGGPLAVRRSRH